LLVTLRRYLAKRRPCLTRERFVPRRREHYALAKTLPAVMSTRSRYKQCDVMEPMPPVPGVSREYDRVRWCGCLV
jgi:hypothetical protein